MLCRKNELLFLRSRSCLLFHAERFRRHLVRAYAVAPRSKEVALELKALDDVEMKCNAVEKEMCKKMFS